MKKALTILFSIALVASLCSCRAKTKPDVPVRSWVPGQHALVNWTGDTFWYPGTILSFKNRQYFISFDDGDKEWVHPSRITDEDIDVDDVVYGDHRAAVGTIPVRLHGGPIRTFTSATKTVIRKTPLFPGSGC